MDNQHRQIKGYRELTQAEIDLVNEIKAKGAELQALVEKVGVHIAMQREIAHLDSEEKDRLNTAGPERWLRITATHFQEGLMALTRAVAQPTLF